MLGFENKTKCPCKTQSWRDTQRREVAWPSEGPGMGQPRAVVKGKHSLSYFNAVELLEFFGNKTIFIYYLNKQQDKDLFCLLVISVQA